jgi:hypothetical protein
VVGRWLYAEGQLTAKTGLRYQPAFLRMTQSGPVAGISSSSLAWQARFS